MYDDDAGDIAHDMENSSNSNGAAVAALKEEVKKLTAELKSERRNHEKTLLALDKARKVDNIEKIKVGRARTRSSKDLVEIIVSDVHGNKADPNAVGPFLQDVKAIGPDRIVLGGDILDCGGFLAEHHVLGYVAETADSYEEDVAATNVFLDQLQECAPNAEIHYIEGNHEWRVERWVLKQKLAHHKDVEMLRRTFAAEYVLHLEKRGIKYYRQGELHMGLEVPGWIKLDKLFFTHKLAGGLSAARTALGKTAANVCFFDTHRGAFHPEYRPGTGLISSWNPGCMCKRQPLYMNTNPSGWTHGYLMRFISRKTGHFQMVPCSIDKGESFGDIMFAK